jgi:predicted enzyme related to lactoylglutathione lyase
MRWWAETLGWQVEPSDEAVKNRMHLDVRIGADDVESAVAGLVARGAKFLRGGQQGPHTWVTLADPEGNEFCVSQSAKPAE